MEQALFDDADTLTVREVSQRVERALRRAFPPKIWVRGEIQDLKRPASGHVYFRLVGDGCSLPVVLWAADKHSVNNALRRAGNAVRMDDGTEVRIRVEVGWFAARGEVSLRMLAIDPAFTLGRLAEQREVLLRRLAAEGILRAQERLPLAPVPLRVGLVTSVGSAAHADALEVLRASGHGWHVVEIDARVQGPDAAPSLVAGLRRAASAGVDVVCLVRGGGARTDLAAYDGEELVRAIAGLEVPVLTGIGHEIDTSVADEVAWRRHVTPTACMGWLVERVQAWCDRRDATFDRCLRAAATASARAGAHLDRAAARAAAGARNHLRSAGQRLDARAERLARTPAIAIAAAGGAIDHRAARVAAGDPALLLGRGWSITRTTDGRLVRSPVDASVGTDLVTTTAGGDLHSTVTEEELTSFRRVR